jgi:geranylgeranyl diphosphate synthase type II
LIHALKLAEGNMASELRKWIEISDQKFTEKKIQAVTSIYNRLNIRTICEDKMDDFYTKAIAKLLKVSVLENKKQELRNLAEKLMVRND